MFKRKQKIVLIEINFAPKKKRVFLPFLEGISLTKKEVILYAFSLLTLLIYIFGPYFVEDFLNQKRQQINILNRKIAQINGKIRYLERRLSKADLRFKDFYIPQLKEKVFIIWYKNWYRKKVIPTIKEFQNLIKGTMPYMGVWVFPNFSKFGRSVIERYSIPKGEIKYIRISGNPFQNPRSIPYTTLPNFYLVVKGPRVDSKFARLLNKIRDKNIKANLLLEYTLLKNPLHVFHYSSTALLIFPINLVKEQEMNSVLNNLHYFCNLILINKEAKREIIFNNTWKTTKVLEGLCIKYAY